MNRAGPPSSWLVDQAVALHRQGRLDEAGVLYEQVLAREPRNVAVLHDLALVRAGQGSPDQAARLLRRALKWRPHWAEAQLNMGNMLLLQGQPEAALPYYRKAISVKPDFALARNSMGAALARLGRFDEAVPHFEKAVALDPDYVEAQTSLGVLLSLLQRPAEAVPHLQRAIAAKPDYAAAHANLGSVLLMLDRDDEALRHFETALALSPQDAQSENGRGGVLVRQGQVKEAVAAFRRAVALDPGNPVYYWALVKNQQIKADDPCIRPLEALAANAAMLPPEGQLHLHFALAKVYADVAEPRRAEPHLLAGNALKRRQFTYDEAAELQALDETARVFTPELLRARAAAGEPSQTPVFVLGMPRSGSTLVEQILAGHSQVFGAGELDDFEAAVTAASAAAGKPFPQLAAALDGDGLRRLGADYVARVTAAAPGMARIVDKMPDNFRYVGLIHLALPNARIIHTLRDPIDTCLSCFAQLFTGNLPYTYDLGELARFYRAYRRLMQHWRAVLPPGVMLDVSYEAVVADLDKEARRIVAHCGLPWEDACLDFHRTARVVKTASAAQVRQPLYQGAVGRARGYPELVARLTEALGAEGLT